MTGINHERQFAFALMAIAGWCDATGFGLFAQLYVSFMSGDATQLGFQVGHGNWSLAAKFLLAQILFVTGATIGRAIRIRNPAAGRSLILGVNTVLLAATAIAGQSVLGVPAYVFAASAMGLQNATMTEEDGVPIGTMVTGALARLGANIADRLSGKSAPIGDNAGQWGFFVLGALGGALAYRYAGSGSFWVPAVASALLIPVASTIRRPGHQGHSTVS